MFLPAEANRSIACVHSILCCNTLFLFLIRDKVFVLIACVWCHWQNSVEMVRHVHKGDIKLTGESIITLEYACKGLFASAGSKMKSEV